MKKIIAIVTFITGYVLGSKAGKKRYEQIKKYSNKFYKTPIVEKTVNSISQQTENFIKKQGEKVTDKIAEVVKNSLFTVKVSNPETSDETQTTQTHKPQIGEQTIQQTQSFTHKNINKNDTSSNKNNSNKNDYSAIDTNKLPE